jgi:glycosyltransferase involved in cell wall biosynthesis
VESQVQAVHKLAYVIPAFNESKVIERVIVEVRQYAPPGIIIVVDDASSDDTAEVAERAKAIVLRHPLNRGQGASLQTGFDAARLLGADVVVTFDADGQHSPADVHGLLEALQSNNAEVALGSRFLTQNSIPAGRRFVLSMGILFTRAISRISVTDTHNGLRAIRARVLDKLRVREDRMAHASELLDLIALEHIPFVEVPCTVRYSDYSRQKGQRSGAAPRIAFDFLFGKFLR